MQQYVLGFAFTAAGVLLIQKQRPEWQAGRYNGIGGKVEEGEAIAQAMVREFKEEAGVSTAPGQWECLGHLYRPGQWFVYVYMTQLTAEQAAQVCSMTGETVRVFALEDIGDPSVIENVPVMVSLACIPKQLRPSRFMLQYDLVEE